MPIEFRCSGCGKLLRTADDSAGKQAKCPDCGTTQPIPAGSPPAMPPVPSASPFSTGGAPASPFGAGPSGPPDSENPYQATGTSPGGSDYIAPGQPYASSRVQAPAMALMVTMIISMPFILLGAVINMVSMAGGGVAPAQQEMAINIMSGGIGLVLNFVGLAIGVVILFGAIKMKNLQNYQYAMTASILAMIPCLSPCCLLGLPFGIWALVVLNDPNVKASFR